MAEPNNHDDYCDVPDHDGHVCVRCGLEYLLRDDAEPTPHCDSCAHARVAELETALAERDAKISWLWQERVETAKFLPPDSGFDLERADDRLQDAVASVLAEREQEREALRDAAQAVVNYCRSSDYRPYHDTLEAFIGRLAAVLAKREEPH